MGGGGAQRDSRPNRTVRRAVPDIEPARHHASHQMPTLNCKEAVLCFLIDRILFRRSTLADYTSQEEYLDQWLTGDGSLTAFGCRRLWDLLQRTGVHSICVVYQSWIS